MWLLTPGFPPSLLSGLKLLKELQCDTWGRSERGTCWHAAISWAGKETQETVCCCTLLLDTRVYSQQKEIDFKILKKRKEKQNNYPAVWSTVVALQCLQCSLMLKVPGLRVWRHCVTGFSGGRKPVAAWLVYFTTAPCKAATRHTAASVPVPALRRPPAGQVTALLNWPLQEEAKWMPKTLRRSKPLKKHSRKKTFWCTFQGLSWKQHDGDCQFLFFF